MAEYKKCKYKKDGYLESGCKALQDAIQHHPTARSKGLFAASMRNIKTDTDLGVRVTVHSGDFVSRSGIMANYCPFCAGQMYDFERFE